MFSQLNGYNDSRGFGTEWTTFWHIYDGSRMRGQLFILIDVGISAGSRW